LRFQLQKSPLGNLFYELTGYLQTSSVVKHNTSYLAGAGLFAHMPDHRRRHYFQRQIYVKSRPALEGDNAWQKQSLIFSANDWLNFRVGCSIGYSAPQEVESYAGTGSLWCDDLTMEIFTSDARTVRQRRWNLLVLVYQQTSATLTYPNGTTIQPTGSFTNQQMQDALQSIRTFYRDDLPELTDENWYNPCIVIRKVTTPLSEFTYSETENAWIPNPTLSETTLRGVDAVVIVWQSKTTNSLTGQQIQLRSNVGIGNSAVANCPTWEHGAALRFPLTVEAALEANRQGLKREFAFIAQCYYYNEYLFDGSVLVDLRNPLNYRQCHTGVPYSLSTQFRNKESFFHDVYNARVATPSPTGAYLDGYNNCFGISPESWASRRPAVDVPTAANCPSSTVQNFNPSEQHF
jgi:hypothetical protein